MRVFWGIIKLYWHQSTGPLRESKWRVGLIGIILLGLFLGFLISLGAELRFFHQGELNTFELAMAVFTASFFLFLGILALAPYIFFARDQINEMIVLSQFPLQKRMFATFKILDLSLSFVLIIIVIAIPPVCRVLLKGYETGNLFKIILFFLFLGAFSLLTNFVAYIWSLIIIYFAKKLRLVRFFRLIFLVIIWSFASISIIGILPLTLSMLFEDKYNIFRWANRFFRIYIHGGWYFSLLCLAITFLLAWLTFRISVLCLADLYVDNIFWIQNQLINEPLEPGKKSYKARILFFPRSIIAMCQKDLTILLKSFEFWLFYLLSASVFISFGILNPDFIMSIVHEFFPKFHSELSHEFSTIFGFDIVFSFIIFLGILMQIGLCSFKFEGEQCQSLVSYPVSCANVILGKALAFFILILPFLTITLYHTRDFMLGDLFVFKFLYIFISLFFILTVCMVISGASVKHSAANLLFAVSYEGRVLFAIFYILALAVFFLFIIIAEFVPIIYFLSIIFLFFLTYFVATQSYHFVAGLNGKLSDIAFGRGKTVKQYTPQKIVMLNTLFILLPVFLVMLYAFSGIRGIEGYSISWRILFFIWPVMLAYLAFWKKIRLLIRIIIFLCLLLIIPITQVLENFREKGVSDEFFDQIMSYPVRLRTLIKIYDFDDYRETFLETESMKENILAQKPRVSVGSFLLPQQIALKYGYRNTVDLQQLWKRPPPGPDTVKDFLLDLSKRQKLFDYNARKKWYEFLSPSLNVDNANWMFDRLETTRTSYRKLYFNDFLGYLFFHFFENCTPSDQFRLFNTIVAEKPGPDNYFFNKLFEEMDIAALSKDQQQQILTIYESRCRKTLKTIDRILKDNSYVIYPVKAYFDQKKVPVKLYKKYVESYVPSPLTKYIIDLQKFTIPEAFDKIQRIMFAACPKELSAFLPSSKKIPGNEEIDEKRIVSLYHDCPVYAAFLWNFHPALKSSKKYVELILKPDPSPYNLQVVVNILLFKKDDSDCKRVYEIIKPLYFDRYRPHQQMLYRKLLPFLRILVTENPEIIKELFTYRFLLKNKVLNELTYYVFCYDDGNLTPEQKKKTKRLIKYINTEVKHMLATAPEDLKNLSHYFLYLENIRSFKLRKEMIENGVPFAFIHYGLTNQNLQKAKNRQQYLTLVAEHLKHRKKTHIRTQLHVIYSVYQILTRIDPEMADKWIAAYAKDDPHLQMLDTIVNKRQFPPLYSLYDAYLSCPQFSPEEYVMKENLIQYYYLKKDYIHAYLLKRAFGIRNDSMFPLSFPTDNLILLFISVFWPALSISLLFLVSALGFSFIPGYRQEAGTVRKAQWRPTFEQAVILLIGLLLSQIPLVFLLTMSGMESVSPITLTFVNGISFAVFLWIGLSWFNTDFETAFPFKPFSYRLLPAVLVALIGFSILCSEANNVLQNILPIPNFMHEIFRKIMENRLAAVVVICILAPVTEEFMFRGLIMQGFIRNYGKIRAILLTSLLFAVFHLNPYQFSAAFIVGMFLGWLFCTTGSLWPCIIAHAFFNSIGFWIQSVLKVKIPGYNYTVEGESLSQPYWFTSIGVVLVVTGVLLIARMSRKAAGASYST